MGFIPLSSRVSWIVNLLKYYIAIMHLYTLLYIIDVSTKLQVGSMAGLITILLAAILFVHRSGYPDNLSYYSITMLCRFM
jgi:ABC-type xylose transport system permease subunit